MTYKETFIININVDCKDLPSTWILRRKKPTTPRVKKKKENSKLYKYFVNDPGKRFAIVTLLQLIFSI
jgi:hypothetical protein